MDKLTLAWVVFGVYLVATTALALRGMTKTKDIAGFALGNRDMGPVLVGITLAASVASSATFVINPGFVYVHGVSAFLHFGVSATAGVTLGLVLLSRGFRKQGMTTGALTLPHWVGARFGHAGMRTYFAVLNLVLAITFVVLIIKGSALVMQHTLAMSYPASVVLIVGFVFSYILLGGTYAHAYTNALQGSMMVVVALVLVGSGLDLLGGGVGAFLADLGARDPNLVKAMNPESPLFSTVGEVFFFPFVVGFGLVCQPHILTKALYLRSDRDLTAYLVVSIVVGTIFALILLVGLYARVRGLEVPSQDAVMAVYINQAFSPVVGVLISVALLAAGMSTMDGILVGASTIAGSDLMMGALGQRLFPSASDEDRQRLALRASRGLLVAMGLVSFALALDPPALVGLFAQAGIYGLVAASVAPFVFGVFVREVDARDVFAAAIVGPAVHFAHYLGVTLGTGAYLNPAVSATEGVIASFAVLGGAWLWRRGRRAPSAAAG